MIFVAFNLSLMASLIKSETLKNVPASINPIISSYYLEVNLVPTVLAFFASLTSLDEYVIYKIIEKLSSTHRCFYIKLPL